MITCSADEVGLHQQGKTKVEQYKMNKSLCRKSGWRGKTRVSLSTYDGKNQALSTRKQQQGAGILAAYRIPHFPADMC